MARPTGNLGILTRYLADPCLPSWQILAETAGLAGLHAFLSYFQPNLKGTFKEVVGVSWLHKAKTLFSDASKSEDSIGGIALRSGFSFIEFADRASWVVFVAGLAGETLYDWSSMVLANTQCHADPRIQRWHSTDPFLPLNIDGRWQDRPEWSNNTFAPFGDFDMHLVIAPGGYGSISAAVQFNGENSDTLPTNCRISDANTGRIYDAYTNDGAQTFGDNKAGIVWAKVRNNTQAFIEIVLEFQSLDPHDDIKAARKGHCSKTLFTP